jgi:surface protein
MKEKALLLRFAVLVTAMMCALGAAAAEAYANYTPSNTTLTFYYDNLRSSRQGTTYDMNIPNNGPGWYNDSSNRRVTRVVFDPSFLGARPTSTHEWFFNMGNLQSITDMRYLNTSEVTDMSFMFAACKKLTYVDLSHFNTAKVTEAFAMFNGCTGLTSLDLSSFKIPKMTDMRMMFFSCGNLRTIYVGDDWNAATVTQSAYMFHECVSLVGGQGTAYDVNHTDKAYAHIDGGTSNPGYFTDKSAMPETYACYTPDNTTFTFYYDNQRSMRQGRIYDLNLSDYYPVWFTDGTKASVTRVVFDPSFADARPTSTYYWFNDMKKLETIVGINCLNTSEVTRMSNMFAHCHELTSIDLSGFNTSNVVDMEAMFVDCTSLTSLDLSYFNTSYVTNMSFMFMNCTDLRTVYVNSGWTTAAVTNSNLMFEDCTLLVGGQGTAYNESNPMDMTYAHIDGGSSNPGYFTEKPAGLRGDVNSDGQMKIDDVTALINYLLSGDASAINLQAADCDQDGNVKVGDVTALINYLLSSTW